MVGQKRKGRPRRRRYSIVSDYVRNCEIRLTKEKKLYTAGRNRRGLVGVCVGACSSVLT